MSAWAARSLARAVRCSRSRVRVALRRASIIMYFIALASDYDGTLAHDGRVARATLEALDRLTQSGRKLVLVTGRELPDLQKVFPELDRCALIVAENGALLYEPASRTQTLLGPEPPMAFIER